MTLYCGIDEAGRGPVIGPMVMAAVVLDEAGRKRLKELNVRDSKKIAESRRETLEDEIKAVAIEWEIKELSPAQIDRMRKEASLNVIEAKMAAELILSLDTVPHKVFLDSPDNIPEDYTEKIISFINQMHPEYKIPSIVSENKAEDKYVEVGAASVLAKVERDRVIEGLKSELGEFGSGYPSDPVTSEFVRKMVKNGELSHHVRRSWNTLDKSRQRRLDDWA
jgi:ribonuclease HII